MIGKPYKKTKPVTRMKTVKPAGYKDIPTGEFEVVKIRDKDGILTDQERPVTRRLFLPPVREEVTESKEIWAVDHGDEVHEFASEKDASGFVREAR